MNFRCMCKHEDFDKDRCTNDASVYLIDRPNKYLFTTCKSCYTQYKKEFERYMMISISYEEAVMMSVHES